MDQIQIVQTISAMLIILLAKMVAARILEIQFRYMYNLEEKRLFQNL